MVSRNGFLNRNLVCSWLLIIGSVSNVVLSLFLCRWFSSMLFFFLISSSFSFGKCLWMCGIICGSRYGLRVGKIFRCIVLVFGLWLCCVVFFSCFILEMIICVCVVVFWLVGVSIILCGVCFISGRLSFFFSLWICVDNVGWLIK